MNVTFTLTTSNTASGPFNISGTTSGGALNDVLVLNGVTKAELLTGHRVNSIVDTVTGGTITSVGVGTCNGTVKDWFVYPQTATLGYTFSAGYYYFYLSEALVDDITITIADVYAHTSAGCQTYSEDQASIQSPIVFTAGITNVNHDAEIQGWTSISHIKPSTQITLLTYGNKMNGSTFTTPSGTVVTITYDDTCQTYNT
jgi:hypothetical protein